MVVLLSPEAAQEEKYQRENDADQDRSGQRKVECRVLAAVENIARESAQRQAGPAEQHHDAPDDNKRETKTYEQTPEIEHNLSLTLATGAWSTGRWSFL